LFGAEEPVSNLGAPRPPGIPADVVRGTKVGGSIWRRATGTSRPQLLIYAAQYGRSDLVKELLAEPVAADVREPRFCMTALIASAQGRHSEIVGLLITAGAKLELSDVYGRTALGWAAYIDHGKPKRCQSAQLLRRAGAHEPPRGNRVATQAGRSGCRRACRTASEPNRKPVRTHLPTQCGHIRAAPHSDATFLPKMTVRGDSIPVYSVQIRSATVSPAGINWNGFRGKLTPFRNVVAGKSWNFGRTRALQPEGRSSF